MRTSIFVLLFVGIIALLITQNPDFDFMQLGNAIVGENGYFHNLFESLKTVNGITSGVGKFFSDIWNGIKDIFG